MQNENPHPVFCFFAGGFAPCCPCCGGIVGRGGCKCGSGNPGIPMGRGGCPGKGGYAMPGWGWTIAPGTGGMGRRGMPGGGTGRGGMAEEKIFMSD